MPDTDPVIDDIALVDFIARRARDEAAARVYPTAALTRGLDGKRDDRARPARARPARSVSPTAATRVTNSALMRRALTYARDFGGLIMHHPPIRTCRGRRDERGRGGDAPRPFRHAAGRRDRYARARHPPRRH